MTHEKSFFDNRAEKTLEGLYVNYSQDEFLDDISRRRLAFMDRRSKSIGITEKCWWESETGVIEGKSILEVGCGVSYIVPYWLYCKNRVFAVDPSEHSIELQQKILDRLELSEGTIEFEKCGIEELDRPDKFDVISLINVLHHVKDLQKSLQKVCTHLDSQGIVLVTEPNFHYPPRWLMETDLIPRNPIKKYFESGGHIEKGEKAFDAKGLQREFRAAGLKVRTRIADSNFVGYPINYFVHNIKWLPLLVEKIDLAISTLIPAGWAPFEYYILERDHGDS